MFSLNRISFCLLVVAIFTSGSALEVQMDNDTLSLISLYNFSSNSLRTGFEPFYLFTNYFIDNLFEPHIPRQIDQAANLSWTEFADKVISDYGLRSGWFQDLKFSSTFLPGVVNFVIISVLVAVLLPIVGFCFCSYRTCCRGKFSPFDRKFDTYKRKFYSLILFILLIASLLGTVILFFTGQNSLLAFKNLPKLLNSSSGQIDDFSRQEIPQFFSQAKDLVDEINSESVKIFDNTLEQTLEASVKSLALESFFEMYNKDLAPKLNKLHLLYGSITNTADGLNETNFVNASSEAIRHFNTIKILIDPIRATLKDNFKFLDEIKSENFDLNTLLPLMNQKLKKIQTNFARSVNDFVIKIKNQILGYKNGVESELAFYSSNINSKKNVEYAKLAVQFYQYFYYVLLGVSVFMLLLFIMHSLGLSGICSRRMHNNFKQSCHRGVSANFFLAGNTFFFLFAFFLIVLCVLMFLPGITFRNVVCKPISDLEDNHLFQIGTKLANFDKFLENSSVKHIVVECDQKNSSTFLNNKFKLLLDERIGTSISKLMEKFRPEISKIDFDSISKSMLNFQSFIEKVLTIMGSQETNDTLNEINNIIISKNSSSFDANLLGEEFTTALESDLEKFDQFSQLVKDPVTKEVFNNLLELIKKVRLDLNDNSTQEKFKNSLEDILESFTLPQVEQLKDAKIRQLVDALPSCRVLSNLYQSLSLSVCYEFMDNFNTFWITVYILTILFFVIACFAFVQADLFRKYYRYDELLDEEIGDEKGSAQFDMHRQKSGRGNGGAIDAYEMKGYNHSGMKYPSNRSPPSTRNTRA